MDHNQAADLLGAYALDAVAPDEAASLREHLAGCPQCQSDLDEFRDTAALIAGAGEEAPATTWDGIARRLQDGYPPATVTPIRRGWTYMVVAAAAIVALVVGGAYVVELGVSNGLRSELSAARERATQAEGRLATIEAEGALARAVQQATAASGTVSVSLGADSIQETMTIVLTEDGTGYIADSSLPALPADRTYQLWAVVDGKVISAGVLGSDPTIVPFRVDPQGLEALAVTEEELGGVAVSENPILVAWSR